MGEVVPARTSPTLHPPFPPTVHQLSQLALEELICNMHYGEYLVEQESNHQFLLCMHDIHNCFIQMQYRFEGFINCNRASQNQINNIHLTLSVFVLPQILMKISVVVVLKAFVTVPHSSAHVTTDTW